MIKKSAAAAAIFAFLISVSPLLAQEKTPPQKAPAKGGSSAGHAKCAECGCLHKAVAERRALPKVLGNERGYAA